VRAYDWEYFRLFILGTAVGMLKLAGKIVGHLALAAYWWLAGKPRRAKWHRGCAYDCYLAMRIAWIQLNEWVPKWLGRGGAE
jgi:hypothetical protein